MGYEKHFGLQRRPFRSVPGPGTYYPAQLHEEVLERSIRALGDEEQIVVLTGDAGLGKTLLCHCLLQRLGDVRCAFLTNGHAANRTALFQAVLFELSRPYEGRSEQELRLALTEDLLHHCSENGSTLVIIDEGHHLSGDLLEELRMLTNLEGEQGRALQLMLVGQPRLINALRAPSLAALCQRVALLAHLQPWNADELADYLYHHLRLAGGRPDHLLSSEAVEMIVRNAGGVPRVLNRIAHCSLRLAFEAGASVVDAEAVTEALSLIGHTEQADDEEVPAPPPTSSTQWKNVLSLPSAQPEGATRDAAKTTLTDFPPHVVPPRPA